MHVCIYTRTGCVHKPTAPRCHANLVVLIAGGLLVLEAQHIHGRTEGVPVLVRLIRVTAGHGARSGSYACSGPRERPAGMQRQARASAPRGGIPPSCASRAGACIPQTRRLRRLPCLAAPTAASRTCRALRASCAARRTRLRQGRGWGLGLRAIRLTCAYRRARCHRTAPSGATWPPSPRLR